jgi:hypothetical protein
VFATSKVVLFVPPASELIVKFAGDMFSTEVLPLTTPATTKLIGLPEVQSPWIKVVPPSTVNEVLLAEAPNPVTGRKEVVAPAVEDAVPVWKAN